jgi:hypothetical protein
MKYLTHTISIAILLFGVTLATYSQTRIFTYQGKLADNGQPANGNYLFQFKLFDTANNQIGATITDLSATVTDGIFAVQLDFGPTAWTGANRVLEIAVRHTVSDPYVTLNPRQSVTSSPYATRSASAQQADNASTANTAIDSLSLGGIAASQYVLTSDARLSDARPPTAGSPSYIQNTTLQQAASNFNVSGNGTAGGTLSGSTINATTQYNVGGQRILSNGGSNNIFVGFGTGVSITTGGNNAFFGASSGDSTTTGSLNSFFGSNAGQSNVSGGNNSFFGYHSGFNSTGNNNSFFGSNAGTNNSSGFNNAIFGKDAGFNLGTSNNNAFFGYIAGFSNSTGNFNSFIGAGSGQSNLSGASNAFVGYNAGRDNTGGNNNTFLGYTAGLNNDNASGNSFVGSGAGGNNTTGNNNVFVGLDAGVTNDTGSKNTTLGANANVFGSNLNNSTAIGANATVGQSNALILGSINGVNNATADTKVGIGTIYPSERLTIETASNSYGWVHTQGTITMGSYVGGTGGQPYGGWIGTKSSHPLSFFTGGGGAAMTLETSGFLRLNNVDIGGSGPSLCINNSNHISFCSSSLRYKTNVASFTPGLNMVQQLRPITFDWKDGGGHDLGFGAEEVAKVSDLLVIHNKQGQVEGVKYDRISAVLVNAVKEQQDQISSQQDQIELLKKQADTQSEAIKRQHAEIDALRLFICTQDRSAEICKPKN